MRQTIKTIISTILVLALVVGCFAAMPLKTNAAPAPAPGNPAWDKDYREMVADKQLVLDPSLGPAGAVIDGTVIGLNPRTSADGDKIPSNAHSADYPGLYFYWDDKQKDAGVLLVNEDVFDLFKEGSFILTAKNSNNYWGYTITKDPAHIVKKATETEQAVYAFGVPKQIQYFDSKGKKQTEDLKNINMVFIDGKYKDAKFYIEKFWFNEDGEEIADRATLDSALKLNGYVLGENVVKITDYKTAVAGKKLVVTETAPAGFIERNGKASQTITVAWDLKPIVTFENQKQFAKIEIVKIWLDVNGVQITDSQLVADFTINGESATVGINDNKFKEGTTYTVAETGCATGYKLVSINGEPVSTNNGIDVSVVAGKTTTVTFVNQAKPEPRTDGVSFFKTAAGKYIAEWFSDHKFTEAQITAIISDITFELRAFDAESTFAPRFAQISLDILLSDDERFDFSDRSIIYFGDGIPDGVYVIEEHLGSIASKYFTPFDPVTVTINNDWSDASMSLFDYDALYVVKYNLSGKTSLDATDGMTNLGLSDDLLHNGGEIFYIGVTIPGIEKMYDSFCAHGGSQTFAGHHYSDCGGYKVVTLAKHDEILSALNYIEDSFGNLNENRVITQTVIWALLGYITEDDISSSTLSTSEKSDIQNVLANHGSHTSEGKIVDIAYMNCANTDHDFEYCQPQIVPVYKHPFDNTPVDRRPRIADLSFVKTVDGELIGNWIAECLNDGVFNEAEIKAILASMTFELHAVDDLTFITRTTQISFEQYEQFLVDREPIHFSFGGDIPSGNYKIVEVLTGAAADVFKTRDELHITIDKNVVHGVEPHFNYDAELYKVFYKLDGMQSLRIEGLNGGGEIFYICVCDVNDLTVEYLSYCAHAGSERFANDNGQCAGYMIASTARSYGPIEGHRYEDFLSALNYIEDNINSSEDKRLITQVVIWFLLGEVTPAKLAGADLTDAQRDFIDEVIDNYVGYEGSGLIVDLVYLVCTEHNLDNYPDADPVTLFKLCQPQLVPVYAYTYNNEIQ